MRIKCIVHADFETPGVIVKWAELREYDFDVLQPYKGEVLDFTDIADFLIVMGGPQSPLQLDQAPYLSEEIAYIQKYLSENKLVLGFCLGAQLIGEALGAKTEKSPEKEIGVYPIELTAEGENDLLFKDLPTSFNVIHWHSDMPGLTNEAKVLARSAGCPRQIVRYKTNLYGFQCHLEITAEGIKEMIVACPDDLKPSQYTQQKEELLDNNYEPINQLMLSLLDRLVVLSEMSWN